MSFQRRKEWIWESRCLVSDRRKSPDDRLDVLVGFFFALKPFHDYSLCPIWILLPVLYFTPSLLSTSSQCAGSAFYTQSAFYPWPAVCVLLWPHNNSCGHDLWSVHSKSEILSPHIYIWISPFPFPDMKCTLSPKLDLIIKNKKK